MSEFSEQRDLIKWFRGNYPIFASCIRLSLNGVNLPAGKKAAIMIAQFKSQGMVKAESDLFFAIPNQKSHGLFIEMKDFGKKATPEQAEYLSLMEEMGYNTAVCQGAEEAKRVIEEHLTYV